MFWPFYTFEASDALIDLDLGGRRTIKKTINQHTANRIALIINQRTTEDTSTDSASQQHIMVTHTQHNTPTQA
ncbi:hypothetical protein, partial [Staphylococcus aureus]|uniref:hypothetical protein n=1 Tax=Staphylococcus aureus TaxID=1280 RepID=UPI0013A6CD8B